MSMNQSTQLYQMQKIDSEIDQIDAQLNKTVAELKADQSVITAQQTLAEAEKTRAASRKALHEAEEAVQAVQEKISTSEAALYDGSIHNPKELEGLQKETASLKRRLATLEDQQLEAMLELEKADEAFTRCQNALEATRADFSERQAGLLGEKDRLLKNRQRLKAERNAKVGSILPEYLEIYESLRMQKRGRAVALIEDNACLACGASIRPAQTQAARAPSQIVYCTSCGRILYAD